MSHIVVKMIHGHPYLYQVRSERKGSRVKQVFEKYLGRANNPNKDKADNQIATTKEDGTPSANTEIIAKQDNQAHDNWQMLRSLIYARDNGICWICRQFVPLHQYDLGHLVDRCNGGQDDYDNLAVMHKKCNEAKPQHHTMDEHILWLLKTRFLTNKTIARLHIAKDAPQA